MNDGRHLLGKETLTADELHCLLARLNESEFGRSTFPTLDAVAEATNQSREDLIVLLTQIRAERQFATQDARLHGLERSNRQLQQAVRNLESKLEQAVRDMEAMSAAALARGEAAGVPPPSVNEAPRPPQRDADSDIPTPLANVLLSNLHGRQRQQPPPDAPKAASEKSPRDMRFVAIAAITTFVIPVAALSWMAGSHIAAARTAPPAALAAFEPRVDYSMGTCFVGHGATTRACTPAERSWFGL